MTKNKNGTANKYPAKDKSSLNPETLERKKLEIILLSSKEPTEIKNTNRSSQDNTSQYNRKLKKNNATANIFNFLFIENPYKSAKIQNK